MKTNDHHAMEPTHEITESTLVDIININLHLAYQLMHRGWYQDEHKLPHERYDYPNSLVAFQMSCELLSKLTLSNRNEIIKSQLYVSIVKELNPIIRQKEPKAVYSEFYGANYHILAHVDLSK